MCGIIGVISDDPRHGEITARQMLSLLAHRGTDQPRAVTIGNATLGCVRLPIVGGYDGAQPIVDDDLAIAFNGEIYNYQQISPGTDSDTRACLNCLRKEGFAALNRFRGMYAMIVRNPDGQVWAARDPMGIKPLYVWGKDGNWYLASEIKCLAAAPGFDGRFDQILPGHAWTPTKGVFPVVAPPWQQVLPPPENLESAVEELDAALAEAVKIRIPSNGDFAVLVSGGIDSSLVAAYAARFAKPKLVAVGMPGSRDVAAAKLVADHLHLPLDVYTLDEEQIAGVLEKVIWHLETPDKFMIANGVATWFAMAHARKSTLVTLGGDGADELFAGYDYLFEQFDRQDLGKALQFLLKHLGMTELMRLDRMSMAHAIEAREPILDSRVIQAAMRIPVEWKYAVAPDKSIITKVPLRKLADRMLPAEIANRPKLNFFRGAGITDVLEAYADRVITENDYEKQFPARQAKNARTKLDLLCLKMWADMFPQVCQAGRAPVVMVHPWFI